MRLSDLDAIADAEEKTVSLPVFTPTTAPHIAKIPHEFLVRWHKKRQEHEEKVRMRCQTTGEKEDEVMTSVKNFIDDGLLDELCKFRWRVQKEDLTDEKALEGIDAIISSVENASLPDIPYSIHFPTSSSLGLSSGVVSVSMHASRGAAHKC